MEPTIQDIQELRTKFSQKISEASKDKAGTAPDYHPKDLARVASDDKWLGRFLLHHDNDMKEALNMLIETCEWRKSFKVNDITENNINQEYLHEGSMYIHNRDKDNRAILVFNTRKHVKGLKDMEDMKRLVVYWMERIERLDKGEPITLLFDMQNTGLSNLDMEFTKYIVSLIKLYYPNFMNYIIIFEVPWVLNAPFKIIVSWLPTKIAQRIKFLDKKSLKDYVDSSQALKSWGGEDPYEFTFVSEHLNEGKSDENKKKILDQVHFADGSHFAELPLSGFGDVKHEDTLSNPRLSLNPPDAICFNQEGIELSGTFTISNSSDLPLIFKVKTTSPEKFRVRPSFGLLSTGGSASINVVLLSKYSGATILRDKFLVMCYPIEGVDNYNNADLNELWKANAADAKKLEEHKLRCRVPSIQPCPQNGAPGAPLAPSGSPTSELDQKMSQLLLAMNHVTDVNMKIMSTVYFLQSLVVVIGILVIALGVAFLMYGQSDDHCHTSPRRPFVDPPLNLDK